MVGEAVVEAFGPFLIPAALFVVGVGLYGVLVLLTRWGLLASAGSSDETGRND